MVSIFALVLSLCLWFIQIFRWLRLSWKKWIASMCIKGLMFINNKSRQTKTGQKWLRSQRDKLNQMPLCTENINKENVNQEAAVWNTECAEKTFILTNRQGMCEYKWSLPSGDADVFTLEVKGSYKTVLHLMDTREAERETQTRKKEKLWICKRTR